MAAPTLAKGSSMRLMPTANPEAHSRSCSALEAAWTATKDVAQAAS